MKMEKILSELANMYVGFIKDNQKAPNKLYCHPELTKFIQGNVDEALRPLHSAFRINPETQEVFYAKCNIVYVCIIANSYFNFGFKGCFLCWM